MNKIVRSREIYWCEGDDRYVLVIRNNNEIIGLNYMQGDEFPLFLEHYNCIDPDLTKFFKAIYPYIHGSTDLECINHAIWAHHRYKDGV